MPDIELDKIPQYQALKTRKQRDFIRLYLQNPDRDAKKAYIDAGYNPKSCHVNAYRLIASDSVKSIIEYVDSQIACVTVSEDDVVRVWRRALFSDDISWSDRLRASELVAKYRKMFDDNDSRQPIFQIFTSQDISALGIQGITNGKLEHKQQVIDVNKVA